MATAYFFPSGRFEGQDFYLVPFLPEYRIPGAVGRPENGFGPGGLQGDMKGCAGSGGYFLHIFGAGSHCGGSGHGNQGAE